MLFLSPLLYHSKCGNGGGVICFELVRKLAEHHDILILAFANPRLDPRLTDGIEEMRSLCRRVETVELKWGTLRAFATKVGEILLAGPWDAGIFWVKEMRTRLAMVLVQERPDIVIVQFPMMAQYVKCLDGVPTIMDVQDLFFVSRWRRLRVQTSLVQKVKKLVSWLSWTSYEASYYPRFAKVLTLTEQDAAAVGVLAPEARVSTSRVAMAVHPLARSYPGASTTDVAFAGNFAHPPNVDALNFFLDEIWPLVTIAVPTARLKVAGVNIPASLRERPGDQLDVLGFIPDIREFFARSRLSVVPVRFGGGIKVKALESMASGCPVVATPIGAEGLHARDGFDIMVRADARGFADAVVELLMNKEIAQGMSGRAIEHIEREFSWEAKLEDLEALFEELREHKMPRQPAAATS